ncbi:ABC transporter ATP-binding protein [Fibrobacter sp. UWH5]|uniref:ABC transporter ATP-binding protein n=1 Tax=Fibrobacter sp. UWH5 TaxID=1896211 RepID=UPI000934F176|nr:ABC transporter ATP-binding protein [Fibrobacter sp. UWH5]
MVNEPDILLLDEPLSAFDANLRKKLQVELKEVQKKTGTTFIMVTHDQDEAIAVSDRVLVMYKGAIVQDGTPEDVYEHPVNRFVATFMGECNILECKRASDDKVTCAFGELIAELPGVGNAESHKLRVMTDPDEIYNPGDLVKSPCKFSLSNFPIKRKSPAQSAGHFSLRSKRTTYQSLRRLFS